MQRLSLSSAHGHPRSSKSHATILCVDDDHAALTLRKAILEHAGYRVLTADNGCVALELAKTERVDLALVDLDMPLMSGYSVAALLRCTRPGARIVIFSGHHCEEVRGFWRYLDGCIVKGASVPRFLAQIARHLAAGTRVH